MLPTAPINSNRVPSWIVMLGSVLIASHLLAVIVLVIAAPSGPWMTPMGPVMALQPWFAGQVNEATTPYYLQRLKLTHNYHFLTNRQDNEGVYFEALLRDAGGKEVARLKFPDDNANFWVRHRQKVLAMGLGNDMPVPPQMGESVAAPNQQVKTVKIWDMVEGKQGQLKLKEMPEHLVPRDRPMVMKPSDWTILLARSYARHLGRTYGADSVEIIRHSQVPIPPVALMVDLPPGSFDKLESSFGAVPAAGKQ